MVVCWVGYDAFSAFYSDAFSKSEKIKLFWRARAENWTYDLCTVLVYAIFRPRILPFLGAEMFKKDFSSSQVPYKKDQENKWSFILLFLSFFLLLSAAAPPNPLGSRLS